MRFLPYLTARLRALFRRNRLEADMTEEMRGHLEMQEAANRAAGMSPDEARYAARRQFGGVDQIKETCREQRGWVWLVDIPGRVRYAFRRLRRTPGFTMTAVITIAVCLGANLAIFAVVDATLLRALPLSEPERLVAVFNSYPGSGGNARSSASIANYFDRRHAIQAFASVSIYQEASWLVGPTGSKQRISTLRVSPEFFSTLGVPLASGHGFTDENLVFGADDVAVVTDGFWRSQMNADPNVLGRTLIVEGARVSVIGVLPPGFCFLSSRAQIYSPLSHLPGDREAGNRHDNGCEMIARLAPGVGLATAQAEIDAFNRVQTADDPNREALQGVGFHTVVTGLRADHARAVKPMLLLLQAGAFLLLGIGCVNLLNLLLVRACGQIRENAVRMALGAGWKRVAGDVLIETALLGIFGGFGGLWLGAVGIQFLGSLGAYQLPLGATIVCDGRVMAAGLCGAIVLSVVLSVPVIWFHLHSQFRIGLRGETRGGPAGRSVQRLRHGFLVAQIALACVLLASAGLLGISLKHISETPTGFRTEQIYTGGLALGWTNYHNDASRLAFVERLLGELRGLPGVAGVAVTTGLPFAGLPAQQNIVVEGQPAGAGQPVQIAFVISEAGDYWKTIGVPLLHGRFLAESDNRSEHHVCVIDRAVAERYWPNSDPLGRRLSVGPVFDPAHAATVVGVVATTKQDALTERTAVGTVVFPYAVQKPFAISLVMRASTIPTISNSLVRSAVRRIDPELVVDDFRTLQSRIDESLVVWRSPTILAGFFAGLALLLSVIGTYGVLSFSVIQRRSEIGVRMALGAAPSQVARQFLGVGLRLFFQGSVAGIIGAWSVSRAMHGLLSGVDALSPIILVATVAAIGAITMVACMLPARRAAKVNPAVALRAE